MNIVCGTDFSIHANKAVLASAALTAREGGKLSLVHVVDPRHFSNPSIELLKHLQDSRQKRLDELADRARRRAAKVETHLLEGSPAVKLTEFASKVAAHLLVVSANGQIAPTKWLLGSVTDQAVQAADIPTMVVRDSAAIEAWAYGKRPLHVLIAYDFTTNAEAALHWAASLREIAPCEISVLYVASPANERARLGVAPPMSTLYYPSELKKFLEQELRQKCDAVFGEDIARVAVKADWGRPDSQIIELASDDRADLIVAGTSQSQGLRRLGSVSRAVLHYAHMNVACVPIPVSAGTNSATLPQIEGSRPILIAQNAERECGAFASSHTFIENGG